MLLKLCCCVHVIKVGLHSFVLHRSELCVRTRDFFFFTGLMNVDNYVALLARLIEDNEPALVVARAERFVLNVWLSWFLFDLIRDDLGT